MDEVAAVVVGAGVVGLAVAAALARSGRPALVLEAGPRFGTGTSSRSSEVIHAGLYYPSGSLKARLCVAGRDRLYAFCAEAGVPHRRLGKLIVAHTAADLPALAVIANNAATAGAGPLDLLDRTQLRVLEPELSGEAALFSPLTGIVDSHALMQALLGAAEAAGAQLVCSARVARAERSGDMWRIHVAASMGGGAGAGDADAVLAAPVLVNAAGLGAQALAATIAGLAPDQVPPLHLARGAYFTYRGRTPFRHLVYPVPEPGGLGTHLTLDLAGQARFGPDVEWIDRIDYTVDLARRAAFVAGARRIWPGLDPARLEAGYAGIRPKLAGPGEPVADFRIAGPADHGLPGLVNLFGIESPGLTAALAIADAVLGKLA